MTWDQFTIRTDFFRALILLDIHTRLVIQINAAILMTTEDIWQYNHLYDYGSLALNIFAIRTAESLWQTLFKWHTFFLQGLNLESSQSLVSRDVSCMSGVSCPQDCQQGTGVPRGAAVKLTLGPRWHRLAQHPARQYYLIGRWSALKYCTMFI